MNNGSGKVTEPDPSVSILNYHYASPPDAVAQNYGLNRVIGCNETGFKGTGDTYYRQEAWDFVSGYYEDYPDPARVQTAPPE